MEKFSSPLGASGCICGQVTLESVSKSCNTIEFLTIFSIWQHLAGSAIALVHFRSRWLPGTQSCSWPATCRGGL